MTHHIRRQRRARLREGALGIARELADEGEQRLLEVVVALVHVIDDGKIVTVLVSRLATD